MSGFNINIEGILKGMSELEARTKTALGLYGDTSAKKLEATAKEIAPWTDRTGLSRKTIQGGSQWDGDKRVVYVSGNTPQFPFLELAHDKKYAALQPAVNKLSPEILRGLTILFK